MQTTIKRIIAVLNDFTMIDEILGKAFSFAQNHDAMVEILYVHESPLFDVPDFFSSEEENSIDKEKIKSAILEKVAAFKLEKEPVVFVQIDDTPNRVWVLAREDTECLIVTAYHESISYDLVKKITQPILIIKTNTKKYHKIALIINAESPASICIDRAKKYFSESEIELFYDYRYIVTPGIETGIQNIQIIEEAQRETFEALKDEKGLAGKFFIDGDYLDTDINTYLQEKGYDMLYACAPADDFFVSETLGIALLETIACDMLISSRE